MPALYRSADVFLHLSKEESFGNVFIEAMACGLPIVAHDSPRLRWIVGDEEYLVDTDNRAAIADGLKIAQQAPEAERQIRVDKSVRFSWSRIGELYREFLMEVIADTGSASGRSGK